VIEQFAGGVTAVQLTLMELDDVAVAVRFAGAAGTALQFVGDVVTVSTALALVAEPAGLATTTAYGVPLFAGVVAGVV
jgi:hypothetical protein